MKDTWRQREGISAIGEFGYRGLFPMGFIVLTAAAVCVFFIKKVK
ncbi:hypothetical protein [Bifidobacterium santillanense]|nr:hypothetical protein [Bifidobacterium santillanense]